jgi:hypothetical protein
MRHMNQIICALLLVAFQIVIVGNSFATQTFYSNEGNAVNLFELIDKSMETTRQRSGPVQDIESAQARLVGKISGQKLAKEFNRICAKHNSNERAIADKHGIDLGGACRRLAPIQNFSVQIVDIYKEIKCDPNDSAAGLISRPGASVVCPTFVAYHLPMLSTVIRHIQALPGQVAFVFGNYISMYGLGRGLSEDGSDSIGNAVAEIYFERTK